MKVVISGGGTAGHIIPALVIGKALREKGNDIVFVGNANSMEERLATELTFFPINVQKLYRKFTFKHIFFPIKLFSSFSKCLLFFLKFNPDVFVGSGGFVCAPPALAAIVYNKLRQRKILIYFHEQNSYPGLVTRKLGNVAENIFLGNKKADVYFRKSVFVGNPIQSQSVSKGENILLVGGSQGSEFLNKKFSGLLDFLLERGLEIDWQVGEKNIDKYASHKSKKVNIFGFSGKMPEIYNRAGLVICRAGALTIAELQARGLPAILVPLGISAGNHQYQNALAYTEHGSGIVLKESECTEDSLKTAILHILGNYENYENSAEKNSCKNDIGKVICDKIYEDFERRRK